MQTTWGMFLNIIRDAVVDPDFVRKNTLLQDSAAIPSTLAADVKARVDALRPAYPFWLGPADVATGAGNVEGMVTVDALNREIDVAAGDPAPNSSFAIFASLSPPPLEIQGWLLSSDSTILPSELEVHYRFTAADSWKKLLQIDDVRVGPGQTIQFRIFVPTPLGAPKILKRLLIIAEQE